MVTTPVTHVAGIDPTVTPTPDPHNKHTAVSLLPDDADDDAMLAASNILFTLTLCTRHPPWPQSVPTISPVPTSTLQRGEYAYIDSTVYQARS